MGTVNLDDASTWPDDDTELLDIAKRGGVVEAEEEVEDSKEVSTETETETPAEVETPVQESTAPILAADGVSAIPYSVLKETREQLRAAKQQMEQLQSELAQLKAAPSAVPSPVIPTIPAEVEAQIQKARDNWGDDIANQIQKTYLLEQSAGSQQKILEEIHRYIQQKEEEKRLTEEETITAAIESDPTMAAWSKADDQMWFDRAVELHKVLLKTDGKYAAAAWNDRMKILPQKTQLLYGVASQKDVPSPDKVEKGRKKVQEALDTPLGSLSEVAGGSTPDQSEFEKLEHLDGNQLTAYMLKLADNPQKFNAYLRGLS